MELKSNKILIFVCGVRPLVSFKHNCQTWAMISVVIPTLNSEATLTKCMAGLIPAAVDGVVRQVIVADGGSRDETCKIADVAGADIVVSKPGRGQQIRAGIAQARSPWLLILHSDTQLQAGWENEASTFMESVDLGRHKLSAAAFQFALDDIGITPRMLEQIVHLRSNLAKLPYGDQGLLIPKRLHDRIGGYKALPLMEDVDIIRRLGRSQITLLRSKALTDPARYVREGYFRRIARNQLCLGMYLAGWPVESISDIYHRPNRDCSQTEETPGAASQKPLGDINPS